MEDVVVIVGVILFVMLLACFKMSGNCSRQEEKEMLGKKRKK